MVSVCSIISVACAYALLRIKSSNDGPLYRRPETTLYNECSLQLYGVVSNGTWMEIVTQEYSLTSAYCDCRMSLQIILLLFNPFHNIATLTKESDKSESERLFVDGSVENHTSSWVVSGVVIPAVKVNTAPPITVTVTLFISDQGRVERVTVTHMQASIINLYFGFYAFMCVWSFRLTECETMIWVIIMTAGGIISVAYTCVLLRRIRPSNDGSSYKEFDTTSYKICSFGLYGFVSTGTWIENVTQEYCISNAYYLVCLYCLCVSHQILILQFLLFVSKPIVTLIPIQIMTLIPPVDGNTLNAISERSCVITYSRWTAFGCGLGCVLLCHLAGSLTFHNLAYFWRWHKSGEIIKADELADGQSRYGVISDIHGRTTLQCVITALYQALIMLNANVESTSQPCLAICWVLGMIGTALLVLVMPMLYVLHFQSQVYHPWSSKSSTCGDDIGREAVLQESFASIIYFYSRLIVSFRLHSIPWTCVLIGELWDTVYRSTITVENIVGNCIGLWMVFGVVISAVSVDFVSSGITTGRVSVSGKDCVASLLVIQLIALYIFNYSCILCDIRWTVPAYGLACVLLYHLMCVRRFRGICLTVVSGYREFFLWQKLMSYVGDDEQIQHITQGGHSLTSTEMFLKWFSGSCLMSHDVFHPTVMIQTLLWLMVKWSDVSVVQSNHVCYMNLQYEMVVAGHSGSSHMLLEESYFSVFLWVIIMLYFCSVHLRVESCCVRWSGCSTWSWYLRLGELQGSREYSEEDRRWLCSVYEGTCVTDAGIDEDTWWFTGDTAVCLGCSLPLVGQHGLVSGCVSDVEGFRVCLRLQRRCGGILWNDTTPLASTQPARERPPPEPPPAKERPPPEPPPTCESC